MKSKKIALISAADSNYYPLLTEWIKSVKRFNEFRDGNFDLCVLDTGLTEDQHNTLKNEGINIVHTTWPKKIPAHKIRGRDYLKACISRPFFKDYFPDYDIYIWMDGDTWLQTWEPIDLLIRGAEKSGLAICPQTDRAYGKAMRLKWLGPFPWKARSFYYSNAKKAFNGKMARDLFPYPALNAGVFSLTKNAPHWERWQELILKALDKGKVFTAEQLTLGILVYLEKYSAELLPAYCNWLCDTSPVWDEENRIYVEPYLPNHPIGIMHLSGCDKMRADKQETREIKTLTGTTISKNFRYCE